MNRTERAVLRESLACWRPAMHVEICVQTMCALLDECDRLEELGENQLRLIDSYIARCGT